jgi:hypothetical protein
MFFVNKQRKKFKTMRANDDVGACFEAEIQVVKRWEAKTQQVLRMDIEDLRE